MNQEEPRKKNKYRFSTDDDKHNRIYEGYEGGRFMIDDQDEPLEIRHWEDGIPVTIDGYVGHKVNTDCSTIESLLAMLKEHHLMVMTCAERLKKAEATRQECLEQLAAKGVCITEDFFKELGR